MRNTVLIVEDDCELRALVRLTLETAGFKVVEASNAEEAWLRAAGECIEAMVLDLMLPDMDGISLCEMFRKLPRTKDACIMMLTAWATPQAEALGRAAGADDYVTKPFNGKDLVTRLKKHLNREREAEVAAANAEGEFSCSRPRGSQWKS